MKPYIVQLEIDDRKSIVYCKDGAIYKGRCIGDCIVTNDDGEDEDGIRYQDDDGTTVLLIDDDIKFVKFIDFSLFDEELCLGEVISSKDIAIYPNNCKSVSALAKTIIHEVEHLKINSDYNTQKEEVRCKLAEIKDTKNNYDYSDIRRTITEVKKINGYNGMSWR